MLSDLALLACRLIVGAIFVAHGYPKLFGGQGKRISPEVARYLGQGFVQAVERGSPAGFAPAIENLGLSKPLAWAWLVGCLEFFGGIMLAIGWLSRVTALLLAIEMTVAIARVHWRNGLMGQGGFEFPLAMLGSCLALAGIGPGRISIDGADDP